MYTGREPKSPPRQQAGVICTGFADEVAGLEGGGGEGPRAEVVARGRDLSAGDGKEVGE